MVSQRNENDSLEKALMKFREGLYEEFRAQQRINELEERVYKRVMENLHFTIDDQTGPAIQHIANELDKALKGGRRR